MSRFRAAVVGFPVKHSLSPLIHGAWLKAAGIDGAYSTRETPSDRFEATVLELRRQGFAGVNVTLPHKEAALACADRSDDAAMAAGAANLLLFGPEGIEARNTDGIGMLAALEEQAPGFSVRGSVALVIGAGGAARGAVSTLRSAGVAELRVVNRSRDRGAALAGSIGASVFAWEDMGAALKDATLAINATTRGLNGADPMRLDWPTPPAGAAALDMVYRPLRTAFLNDAEAAGWATADGLAMLIGQARPSFTALFREEVPTAVDVRALCLAAMEGDR